MFDQDTIAAVATAIGEGGIGIIRMSGKKSIEIVASLFSGARNPVAIASYQACYGQIIHPDSGEMVDEVVVLVMRKPRSYTREDVVEIHCHGGPIPMRSILELVLAAGARLAEPGEFTKRAFLNGRLDLVQAEAVIDVIRAKTDASLRMAAGNLSGKLSGQVKLLRQAVLEMIAHLEASIDFPEDEIEDLANKTLVDRIGDLNSQITALLATVHTGRILREGLETAIIGKPNVGKSSLLNALLKEKRAIVTEIPGTTRDSIEEFVNIGGIPLKIIDTAGIRETSDLVEQIGVDKAKEYIGRSDLILLMLDASRTLTAEDLLVLDLLKGSNVLIVINKADLQQVLDREQVKALLPGQPIVSISVLEGTGLEQLEKYIVDLVYHGQVQFGEGGFVNNARQAHVLAQAQADLQAALNTIEAAMPPDCVVIDLRAVWEKLGEITGDTVGEDVIDQIFTQFCIGK